MADGFAGQILDQGLWVQPFSQGNPDLVLFNMVQKPISPQEQGIACFGMKGPYVGMETLGIFQFGTAQIANQPVLEGGVGGLFGGHRFLADEFRSHVVGMGQDDSFPFSEKPGLTVTQIGDPPAIPDLGKENDGGSHPPVPHILPGGNDRPVRLVEALGKDDLAGLVGIGLLEGFMDSPNGQKAGFLACLMPAHSIGDHKTRKPGIDQKPIFVIGPKPLKGFRPSHPLECCQIIGPALGKGSLGAHP